MIALFWSFFFLHQKCELQGITSTWVTEALPCYMDFFFFFFKLWRLTCILPLFSSNQWLPLKFLRTGEVISFPKFCFPNWLGWLGFADCLTGFVSRLAKFCYYFANIIIIRRKLIFDMTISCFHFTILFLFAYFTWLQQFVPLSVS